MWALSTSAVLRPYFAMGVCVESVNIRRFNLSDLFTLDYRVYKATTIPCVDVQVGRTMQQQHYAGV